MNNQIILDMNNQSITIDLICYFSSNNKKYIFYSKNETVQDGLIKMYVSEENTGSSNEITQDEWNNLKKVMQGIITGNTTGIEFLSYNNSVKFNEPKAIALNESNINLIKTAYKNVVGISEPTLNKDILAQGFGSNIETVVSEPVQLSSIPQVQNNFNLESIPVNLNSEVVTPPVESTAVTSGMPAIEPIVSNEVSIPNINIEPNVPIMPTMESVGVTPSVSTTDLNETKIPEIPVIEPIVPIENKPSDILNTEQSLNINSIKPSGIDSAFKVSNEPNIFDNPYRITEEEINNINLNETNQILDNNVSNINNLPSDEISFDKKIELNNRKIKLFEELANIYKEENELLKSKNEGDNELEKTASNLFNSNGTLKENDVLN